MPPKKATEKAKAKVVEDKVRHPHFSCWKMMGLFL